MSESGLAGHPLKFEKSVLSEGENVYRFFGQWETERTPCQLKKRICHQVRWHSTNIDEFYFKIFFLLDVGEWELDGTGDSSSRIWCPDVLHAGQWHQLAVAYNQAVFKGLSFSIFLDSQHMHSGKKKKNLEEPEVSGELKRPPPARRWLSKWKWSEQSPR